MCWNTFFLRKKKKKLKKKNTHPRQFGSGDHYRMLPGHLKLETRLMSRTQQKQDEIKKKKRAQMAD